MNNSFTMVRPAQVLAVLCCSTAFGCGVAWKAEMGRGALASALVFGLSMGGIVLVSWGRAVSDHPGR